MSAQEIIANLDAVGIRISLNGDDLRISGLTCHLTDDRVTLLKQNKPQILAYLKAGELAVPVVETSTTPYFKEYLYPDGKVLRLTKEDFDRVVEAVRALLEMKKSPRQQ